MRCKIEGGQGFKKGEGDKEEEAYKRNNRTLEPLLCAAKESRREKKGDACVRDTLIHCKNNGANVPQYFQVRRRHAMVK